MLPPLHAAVSIPNVWAHTASTDTYVHDCTHDVDHVRKSLAGSKGIRVFIEGEPGNEAISNVIGHVNIPAPHTNVVGETTTIVMVQVHGGRWSHMDDSPPPPPVILARQTDKFSSTGRLISALRPFAKIATHALR